MVRIGGGRACLRRHLALALVVGTSAHMACAGARAACLTVVDDAARVHAQRSVVEGERWCLTWRHSVAGFVVRDCFELRNGAMVLDTSETPDFAAGLGPTPGRGRLRSDGSGGYRLEDIGLVVGPGGLPLRIGSPEVDHRLIFKDDEWPLIERVGQVRAHIRLLPDETCVAQNSPTSGQDEHTP